MSELDKEIISYIKKNYKHQKISGYSSLFHKFYFEVYGMEITIYKDSIHIYDNDIFESMIVINDDNSYMIYNLFAEIRKFISGCHDELQHQLKEAIANKFRRGNED